MTRTTLCILLACILGSSHRAGAAERQPQDHASSHGKPSAFRRLANDSATPLLTRQTLAIVSTGAALAALATTFEDPGAMARFLDRSPWDKPADVGNVYGNGLLLSSGATALWAGGAWAHDANLRDAGFDAMRSLGITFGAVAALKLAVRRTRPDGGAYSFPSGHTAGAFAVAPVLARHFGARIAVPAYVLAVMTGMGRLEDRKHFLSDVLFGATIGTAAGLASASAGSTPASPVTLSLRPDRATVSVRF